jgi:hypothetical protein
MAEVHGLVCHGAEDVIGHRGIVGLGGQLRRKGEVVPPDAVRRAKIGATSGKLSPPTAEQDFQPNG